MQTLQIINKLSREQTKLEATNVQLDAISIVKAKINKLDVVELLQEGNTLIVVLTNGERLVIENFYVSNEDGLTSDIVFEEDDGGLYWFDQVAKQYKQIPDIEVLLPSSSDSMGLLPWIAGGAALVGGIAAAASGGSSGGSPSNPGSELESNVPVTPTA
ncbi:BapA prefix-like domain-containing protein, partial [Acinetobacter sp. YH12108]|uniref:BapA/Bap/LapF family prefix-like domain-containing protein n=1 Tax=Acinetobacter sp. YH12108 TaxID=2601095 RepID=UPI0015D312D7